jgi:bifunctional UDP-N-acetylglucosamine pyrophosphorylase/glucosamine-1-phosphate N-acetyltransferase
MKSKRAKALHEICGRPMLRYVLDACYEAGVTKVIAVVGYGKEQVIDTFGSDKRIQWVEQTEQLGTGHAAKMAEPLLQGQKGDVFILTGDGPLVRGEVLKTLHNAHRDGRADASLATAMLDDPTGYGRIVRDGNDDFVEIVEQLDATEEQREIREVFPSIYCLKADCLLFALARLKNENKKREYYLTDVYGILRAAGKKVLAVQVAAQDDVLGVNSRDQLAQVDAIMQNRIQRLHFAAGVTIVSPVNTYIEAGATIGPDTTIHPHTFVGRDATIGVECTIGPFAVVPRDGIVPEGTAVAGNIGAVEAGTFTAG